MVHQVFVVPRCISPASPASPQSRVRVPRGPSTLMSGSSALCLTPAPETLHTINTNTTHPHHGIRQHRQKIYIFVNKTWNIIQNNIDPRKI